MYNMFNNALNPTMLGLKKYHNGQCNRSNNNEKKITPCKRIFKSVTAIQQKSYHSIRKSVSNLPVICII